MLRQAALQRLARRIPHLAAELFPASDVSGSCLSRDALTQCLLATQPAHIAAPSASAAATRLLNFCTPGVSLSLARGLATEAGVGSGPSTAGPSEDSRDAAAGSSAADGGTQTAESAGTSVGGSADASAPGADPSEAEGESQVPAACMQSLSSLTSPCHTAPACAGLALSVAQHRCLCAMQPACARWTVVD